MDGQVRTQFYFVLYSISDMKFVFRLSVENAKGTPRDAFQNDRRDDRRGGFRGGFRRGSFQRGRGDRRFDDK